MPMIQLTVKEPFKKNYVLTHCEGALSGMPAVRAFALYAGMALLIDFLMQVGLDQT